MIANLCLLLVSCLVGLSLCEMSLRLFYPRYRPLAEAFFIQDEKMRYRRAPNSRSLADHPDHTGLNHFLHTNNFSLRQHRNFSETDLTSATNVGFFGDSFVENIGMAVQYSFTEPLDYLLNQGQRRFNVLNFGVYGYGPGQSFLRYKHFDHAKELDHVVYVYYANDLRELVKRKLFDLDDAGHLIENPPGPSFGLVRLISRLHLVYLILDGSGRLSPSLLEEWEADIREWHLEHRRQFHKRRATAGNPKQGLVIFRQMLRRWKHSVESNGNVFSVVLLPVGPGNPDLVAVFMEEDIEVFDLYSCFSAIDPAHADLSWSHSPYRFKNDSHWNEAGNHLAAICLYRFLEEKMRLPKSSEDTLQEALHRYYLAFGGYLNVRGGGGGGGGR